MPSSIEAEHYLSSSDIARILGVHHKSIPAWCRTRLDIPHPDITLGPTKFRGWLPHRVPEWKRWYARTVLHE